MKTCTKCQQTKSLDEFYNMKASHDGKQYWCKSCLNTANENRKSQKRDVIRAEHARYRDRTREHKREIDRRYAMNKRATKMLNEADVYEIDWNLLRLIFGDEPRCLWCGNTGESWDHVIPLSEGGAHHTLNLVPACRGCNSSKNNRRGIELVDWIKVSQ